MDMRLNAGNPEEDHGWPSIRIDGQELGVWPSIKYLGVYLDIKNRWNAHFKYILQKCCAGMAPLMALCRRTFGYSNAARRIMAEGTICNHLDMLFQHLVPSPEGRAHLSQRSQMVQRRSDTLCNRL